MRYEEDIHQGYLVQWFKLRYSELEGLLYHIPNGQNVGMRAGARLKRSGLISGIPDLHLAYPTSLHPGLYIEMKSLKGRSSPQQKRIQGKLRDAGYRVEVCNSFNSAKAVIEDYLPQTL